MARVDTTGLAGRAKHFVQFHQDTVGGGLPELDEMLAGGLPSFTRFVRMFGPLGVYGKATYTEVANWRAGGISTAGQRNKTAAIKSAVTVLLKHGAIDNETARKIVEQNV